LQVSFILSKPDARVAGF